MSLFEDAINGPEALLLGVIAAALFYGLIIYTAGLSARREIKRRQSERTGA